VIGDRRKFLRLLIMIDYDNVASMPGPERAVHRFRLALPHGRGTRPESGGDRAGQPELRPRRDEIKKFRMIEQQLTAEDDEVTPTLKLKRKFVNDKYKAMIESMYGEAA